MDPLAIVITLALGVLGLFLPFYFHRLNERAKTKSVLEEAHAQLKKIQLAIYRVAPIAGMADSNSAEKARLDFNKFYDEVVSVGEWYDSNRFKLPEKISSKFGRFILLSKKHMITVFNNKHVNNDLDIWKEYEELKQDITSSISHLNTKNPFRKF